MGIKYQYSITDVLNKMLTLLLINIKKKKIIQNVIHVIITDKLIKFLEVFNDSAITIALLYLKLAKTAKIEHIDINNAKDANSEGE